MRVEQYEFLKGVTVLYSGYEAFFVRNVIIVAIGEYDLSFWDDGTDQFETVNSET